MSRAESPAYVDELLKKGEEARQKVEAMVQERVQAVISELKIATQEDIARLERRLEALEQRENSEG
jgi:polyhydroxyalkanoate synthesis regulator phasin